MTLSLTYGAARSRGLARLAALALGLSLSGSVLAEKADHDKPTNIVYDHAQWDDLKQIYIFTGNVILTKGTIIVRCDNLRVHQDPEGYDFAVATMDSPARQVFFRQRREGYPNQYIEGVGDKIEYDEKADNVTIFQRAIVKRLDSEVLQDDMHGDTITYNSLTEQYHIEGGGKGLQGHVSIAPAKGNPAPAPATPGANKDAGAAKNPAASPAGASAAPASPPVPATPARPAVGDPALKDAPSIGTKPYD
jgi:lipopolysaccharide export system protein LptA